MNSRPAPSAPAALPAPLEPGADCARCPRLAGFRADNRATWPTFFNAPVPAFGPLRAGVLVIGLAPGLKGANQTGRPFTGDAAGELLYPTLLKFGLARGVYGADPGDGLEMTGARITNAVRCVPPQNKVTGAEVRACNGFLQSELAAMPHLHTLVTLGTVAHGAVLKALGLRLRDYPFGHGAAYPLPAATLPTRPRLLASYHCSRYNTNTGRLTAEMFEAVFANASGKSS